MVGQEGEVKIKVADFGLSTQYEMNRYDGAGPARSQPPILGSLFCLPSDSPCPASLQVGTPLFFAPELFGWEGQAIGYTRSVDCWACG